MWFYCYLNSCGPSIFVDYWVLFVAGGKLLTISMVGTDFLCYVCGFWGIYFIFYTFVAAHFFNLHFFSIWASKKKFNRESALSRNGGCLKALLQGVPFPTCYELYFLSQVPIMDFNKIMVHYVRWLYCICSIKNMHFIQFDVITWPCLRGEAFSGTLGGMHHIGISWTLNCLIGLGHWIVLLKRAMCLSPILPNKPSLDLHQLPCLSDLRTPYPHMHI